MLRVIGGRFRGRRLKCRAGRGTRPTLDRVREALASAIESRLELRGICVLDIFSGSGAFGFEMLSRGAGCVVAVEKARAARVAIESNAAMLDVRDVHYLLDTDVLRVPSLVVDELFDRLGSLGLRETVFDLVFADPPFVDAQKAAAFLDVLSESSLVSDHTLFALEFPSRDGLPAFDKLVVVKEFRYGDSGVVLLRK